MVLAAMRHTFAKTWSYNFQPPYQFS